MAAGLHNLVPLNATQTAEREVWSEVLEGTYEECLEAAAQYKVGTPYPMPTGSGGDDIWNGQHYQPTIINTGLNLSRKAGGLAELSHSYMSVLKREMWSLDMAEISKDIRTWLVLQMGEVAAAPELAKIAQWQAAKDAGDYGAWAAFQYYDDQGVVHDLEGDTLTLAQKMIKGVDSYTIYAPVLTRTTLWATLPDGVGNVGVKEVPTVREGWEVIGVVNNDMTEWTSLADDWVKTASRSSPNQDGTYTLVEQWTGMDEADPDLYPSAAVPIENGGGE